MEKPNGNVIVYRAQGINLLVNPGGYGFFMETEVPDKEVKPRSQGPRPSKAERAMEQQLKTQGGPEKKGLVA